jgi:hypothetical protein
MIDENLKFLYDAIQRKSISNHFIQTNDPQETILKRLRCMSCTTRCGPCGYSSVLLEEVTGLCVIFFLLYQLKLIKP